MEELISKLARWGRGKKAPPNKVLVYPTNRCNLECPFCFQRLKPYDYSKDLPKKRWLELTKELCEMGVDIIQISGGGEPMMVPETTLKMMEIIKENKVMGRIVTNGTLWREKDIKMVTEMEWDNVIFSVDGATPEVNDKSRGVKGTFKKIVKNIKLFNYYKKLLKKEKPFLEFSTVVSKINFFQLGEIIKLAGSYGVKNITFEPVFVSNPNVEKLKVSQKERDFILKKISEWKELATVLGVSTNLDVLFEIKEIEKTGDLKEKILEFSKDEKDPFLKIPCFEPWIWPKIEADGRVGPCSTIFLSDFCKKEVSVRKRNFEDVWYGEEFEAFRKVVMSGKILDSCSNCVSTHLSWNLRIREELRKVL
ncbi:MAG: radical SAM protein [Candidatus Aenigmatarchaeota archaeon]